MMTLPLRIEPGHLYVFERKKFYRNEMSKRHVVGVRGRDRPFVLSTIATDVSVYTLDHTAICGVIVGVEGTIDGMLDLQDYSFGDQPEDCKRCRRIASV